MGVVSNKLCLIHLDSAVFNLPTERGGRYPSEEEELLQLEPLLRIMKPKVPHPPPPPPLPIKKSSSTGNNKLLKTTPQINDMVARQLGGNWRIN